MMATPYSGAVYYRSCLCVCNARAACVWVCLWVCYHDNSKLRASILTKLGLWVKVVTISSWLNFGRPAPPGRRGEHFWLRITTASAQCLRLSERFFINHFMRSSHWPNCWRRNRTDVPTKKFLSVVISLTQETSIDMSACVNRLTEKAATVNADLSARRDHDANKIFVGRIW